MQREWQDQDRLQAGRDHEVPAEGKSLLTSLGGAQRQSNLNFIRLDCFGRRRPRKDGPHLFFSK